MTSPSDLRRGVILNSLPGRLYVPLCAVGMETGFPQRIWWHGGHHG
jgi:hypothetical protein